MPTVDADNAQFFIYVYKEGALSRVGHDLKLQLTHFSFSAGEDLALEAKFDLHSIVVIGSVRNGVVHPGDLSSKDKKDIEQNMAKSVLETERHPEAVFRSTGVEPNGDGYRVRGLLSLHGVDNRVRFDVKLEDGQAVAEVLIELPDYGMKPYKALLGALKTKREILVEARAPVGE